MKSNRNSRLPGYAMPPHEHFSLRVGPHPHALALGGGAARRFTPSPRAGRRRAWLLVMLMAVPAISGCRQDMHNQPKYRPLRASGFFADGASARPLVEGTVARGLLHADEAFYTGRNGDALVREMPLPVDEVLLVRGRERYNIFCAPCHDTTGSGNGMVVQRGYRRPPSLHEERLRQVEAGHFFDVMTQGFGAMPDYRQQVSPRDRWAITAYIRALQLSQPVAPPASPGAPPQAPAGPGAGQTR